MDSTASCATAEQRKACSLVGAPKMHLPSATTCARQLLLNTDLSRCSACVWIAACTASIAGAVSCQAAPCRCWSHLQQAEVVSLLGSKLPRPPPPSTADAARPPTHLQHVQVVPHQRLPAEGQVGAPPLLQLALLLRQRGNGGLGRVERLRQLARDKGK